MHLLHIGGIPFPLNGDNLPSNPNISPNDFKILMKNADVIIDQTEFPDGKGNYSSTFSRWRALAGFSGVDIIPRVLDMKMVFSLDNTVNKIGINGKEPHRRHQIEQTYMRAGCYLLQVLTSIVLLCTNRLPVPHALPP